MEASVKEGHGHSHGVQDKDNNDLKKERVSREVENINVKAAYIHGKVHTRYFMKCQSC